MPALDGLPNITEILFTLFIYSIEQYVILEYWSTVFTYFSKQLYRQSKIKEINMRTIQIFEIKFTHIYKSIYNENS